MQERVKKIYKNIHIKDKGYSRIAKNMHIKHMSKEEIMSYCRQVISDAGIKNIRKKGKNYYITSKKYNTCLTIHCKTYTVITAHKLDAKKNNIIFHYVYEYPIIFLIGLFNIFVAGTLLYIHNTNIIIDRIGYVTMYKNEVTQKQRDIEQLLDGYPMEKMAPYIAQYDDEIASFIIAIAKKESAWGKHAPQRSKKDCYNYWGFRRQTSYMTNSGYTCFQTPKKAVSVIASRINDLYKKGYDTPQKMIIWKCGDCTGSAAQGSAKWISDVAMYYNKVYTMLATKK